MAFNRKKQANAHEKKLAKRLGGRRTPASGALDGFKGDIVLNEFLIDDKLTDGKSITVTKDMIMKINREAREAGKSPVLSLSFKGLGLAGDTWYLIPEHVFRELNV
jgi:hypothetical protein